MKDKQNKNEWLKTLAFVVVITVAIRTFLFTPVSVDGASMEPTLHNREKIIVSKTINWIGEIHRGDIVIIKDSEEKVNYVKRVIGLPGETIEMENDHLRINGKEIDETYLTEAKKFTSQHGTKLTEDFGPIAIPDDHYFVMGDNRPNSMDSRGVAPFSLGFISEKQIIGKSKFVIFPLQNIRMTY
ncbi:signal peptidase I [Lederbergia galactosidilytica]|uniref:Signal peptidase I n=1 Tax=Lederbergia galactosidilytica TaxID=217031 RepID=A0A178A298_9BACI|nr:signal peptidase I [Lederbergia galactosidilytica]KRG16158.1 signal peptidase [Virgibacillus soli]OAK74033.1 signal peptidase [Lederbergia galactosidilytica]